MIHAFKQVRLTNSLMQVTGGGILQVGSEQVAYRSQTGQFITTAQTGHIHSQYALSAGTGQFVSTAQTGHVHSQYALSAGTGQFISTAQTGQFIDTSKTGIFTTTGDTRLLNFANLTQNLGASTFYPCLSTYIGRSLVTGGIIFNTPIYRTGNMVFMFHVYGYDDSDARQEDVYYAGKMDSGEISILDFSTGCVAHAAINDLVWNGRQKSIGINKSGYLAIGLKGTGDSSNTDRYIVDAWLSSGVNTLMTSGWTWSIETGVYFGFKDIYISPRAHFCNVTETGEFIDSSHTGLFITQGLTGQFAPIAQTGHIHSQYALTAGTGQFISTAQTGAFAPIAQTGHIHSQYALVAGTGQFVSTAQTGHIHSQYALSSATGQFVDSSETGQFVTTSMTGHVHSQYALSAGTGQFISTAQTGQFAPIAQTGHIHSQYALSAGTGQFITTAQTGVFSTLLTQQIFVTSVPTGIDDLAIFYPVAFQTVPKVLASVEISGDTMYAVNVRGRNASGYTACFSDTVQEDGVYVHTLASV